MATAGRTKDRRGPEFPLRLQTKKAIPRGDGFFCFRAGLKGPYSALGALDISSMSAWRGGLASKSTR